MGTIEMPLKKQLFWCSVMLIFHSTFCEEVHDSYLLEAQTSVDTESRGRRDVIEEEKYYNIRENKHDINQPTPWLPHPLPPEDPTTITSLIEESKALPQYQTTERVTDKPTGRGARASNENWIKLPFPPHDNNQDDILTPPQMSGDLINSRMPRINFVTQNKQLETSESRNDKESVRPSRTDDLRTDFVRPGEDDRKQFKPVYPRQALYYPEERRYYDDTYYPREELYARRDPYFDPYSRRARVYPISPVPPVSPYSPRVPIDRYDDPYDYVPRKPKRIIYYANLPEVVRTPPSVDLRYRYSVDPYRRYDEGDYYGRTGRYDYRFRNRPYRYPPYSTLRKDDRNYRDLSPAGTIAIDKKIEEKVTPAPILPKKEESYKSENNRNPSRNLINSHQYHDGLEITYTDPKQYQDLVRPSDSYLRYDEPLFQSAVDEPYQRKY